MELLTFLPATFLGFALFKYTSNPKYKIAKWRPNIKLWRFELMPCLKIRIRGRIIHFHHWMSLSLILTVTVFMNLGILDMIFTKGLIVGGIVQGLTFPDYKNIVYKVSDYTNSTSISSTAKVVKETS